MPADPPVDPPVESVRLVPLLPRRPGPSFVVDVDAPTGQRALAWALREAARREGTVLAVVAVDAAAGDPLPGCGPAGEGARGAALARADAAVVRAIAETGVTGRVRAVVVDRPLLDALGTAGRGGDLVLVGGSGRTLLRPVAPRFPGRRLAPGA